MTEFAIHFLRPWLLLLLIPAIGLALLPYFRLQKRYRRNRNRVTSVVLHCVVMVLSILVLSGMWFSYDTPNKENEILLLVDASYSNREEKAAKDAFLETVAGDCGSNYKLGIVKFGYDQKYAAPFSNDADEVFAQYLRSEDPDTSATDVAAALTYARTLFSNPQTGKIVLLSDGIETDGQATRVIKAVSAEGIRVDVAHFPNAAQEGEVQLIGLQTPDYNPSVGEEIALTATLATDLDQTARTTLTLYDNGVPDAQIAIPLAPGTQTYTVPHTFTTDGLHELRLAVAAEGDTVPLNNAYYAYMYLAEYNNILVVEKYAGESDPVTKALGDEYNVRVVSIEENTDGLPADMATLCNYEQVILVNVANSDIKNTAFNDLLVPYVEDCGGGLFTLGGKNGTDVQGKPVPHAYNRDDMLGSNLQTLLPVHVVDYTPPAAVVFVIDSSGSMGTGNNSLLAVAKRGALACLNALSPRDWCGIVTFDQTAAEASPLLPVANRDAVRNAINGVSNNGSGGTVFSDAIDRAGEMLSAVDVERKHIVILTDGQPGDAATDPDTEQAQFMDKVKINIDKNITMSIVAFGSMGSETLLRQATDLGKGHLYYGVSVTEDVAGKVYEDLRTYATSEIEYGREFTLRIASFDTPVVSGIKQTDLSKLPFKGYYGTQLKEGADAPLMAEYSPMYAQWTYGQGKVGSFMCDFGGEWSKAFADSETGALFLRNAVQNLFPTNGLQNTDIDVTWIEDNYGQQMNVYAALEEDERVDVTVMPVSDDAKALYGETVPVTAADGYTRFNFALTCPGLYHITVQKKDASGTVVSQLAMYKTFSWSEEYDRFPPEPIDGAAFLASLAADGNGIVLQDSLQIYDTFDKYLHKTADPRIPFLIVAMVLFLADIAVRKFKFKWLHEILRDRKEKRSMQNGKS